MRAAQNRVVDSTQRYLWQTVRAASILGTITVELPRKPGQVARNCTLSLRSVPITLAPRRDRKQNCPVSLWAVLATEETPPAATEPVEWLLLTTLPTPDLDDAIERVHWYTEVWHRVLKTGCRIEARQLETVERLSVALTLYSIIAWRILYATILARVDPDLPCTVLLSDDEWRALHCNIHRVPSPPDTPPTLAQAVLWIAKLGGFLARKGDLAPGPQVLWRGMQHLPDITEMYIIMRPRK